MPIKDLPGYYPTIKEGGLGVLPPSLAGLFCLIGTSEQGTTDTKFTGDAGDVLDEYGYGTLTEHAYDAFCAGASQIGIVRATAAKVETDITVPEHKIYGKPTGEGGGGGKAVVATGYASPHTQVGYNRRYRLRIVKGGSLTTATYQVSANNGLTWSAEKAFAITTAEPTKKSMIEMDNGTYIEFTEDTIPADSFVAGDEYRWWCYEPRATENEIITACEKAAAWKDPTSGMGFEYVYVSNLSAQIWNTRDQTNITSFWTALITIAENLWTDEQRPIFFICNAPSMLPLKDADALEEVDDWIDLLVACAGAKNSARLVVNAAQASLTDVRGSLQLRMAGGSAAGLVSKADLHHSIGWVRYMSIANSLAIYPSKPIFAITGEDSILQDGFLAKAPVVPWSVKITTTDEPVVIHVDGGDGVLYDQATGTATGTIEYATGHYYFLVAPTVPTADYEYITNAEMGPSNVARLNDARYLSFRHFIGYGIRFTDDWTRASPTSDYYCIRNRRIMDESVRMVGVANMPYVNSPGITEKDMAAYKADLSRPLEAMKITEEDTDKPIMDYVLTLRPDANIWSNGIMHCKVEIVPTPTKKKLEATFQLRTKVEQG
ncbi:hypothetical protein CEE36_08365 [candidate division TA06 bacterium B3_TA06]|uniref:Uncharacterized protein n=1 Tax=candidate division TA06 bacterium B3_TA06 TaxID=2012487 RepID=A0A532V2F1_UNCT6|nr:MAG: hypothetical protein CEE36_08365 [candidate division TA06 bacterium B3_TA06]